MNDRAWADDSSLAAAVRRRRHDLGLTQAELADLAEVSTRFVHMLEAGKPSVQLAPTLRVLGVLGRSLQVVPGDGTVVDPGGAPGGDAGARSTR